MNIKWVVGIIIFVIILSGGYVLSRQTIQNKMEAEKEAAVMLKELKNDVMMKDDSGSAMGGDKMMDTNEAQKSKTDDIMMENQTMMQKPGAYKEYSQAVLAEAVKDKGKTVLFFWASWCPYCKTANEDFINNADQIPQGVTVLKTNYDTEKELKTKYGIIYQHTFVQVDAEGNQVAKWSGGGVNELKTNIK